MAAAATTTMSSNKKRSERTCGHHTLQLETSRHADDAGYKRPSERQRMVAATSSSSQTRERRLPDPNTFPAPLVLPYDDLADDPKWPPQPFKEWRDGRWRNPVMPERRTLYIAHPPSWTSKLRHMHNWTLPVPETGETDPDVATTLGKVSTEELMEYVAAFYHPLPVKLLQPSLEFALWEDDGPKTKRQKAAAGNDLTNIGISTGSELIQIRNRPCPDGVFQRQLNLLDLLDVAIEVLPADAYALLLITDHDLYENDSDDFCCGRAFGGSRVAVVSTARYLTELDSKQDVDSVHSWPASHCAEYVERYCALYSDFEETKRKRKKKTEAGKTNGVRKPKGKTSSGPSSQSTSAPLQAAISVYNEHATWNLLLARVARTACHELGHCFGMDHCVYYACSMQGTSSAAEDARQPPYLCPVDLAKVLYATSGDEVDRYKAMLSVCGKFSGPVDGGGIWSSHAAWIEAVLKQRDREFQGRDPDSTITREVIVID